MLRPYYALRASHLEFRFPVEIISLTHDPLGKANRPAVLVEAVGRCYSSNHALQRLYRNVTPKMV